MHNLTQSLGKKLYGQAKYINLLKKWTMIFTSFLLFYQNDGHFY